jgi:hypothetical protein
VAFLIKFNQLSSNPARFNQFKPLFIIKTTPQPQNNMPSQLCQAQAVEHVEQILNNPNSRSSNKHLSTSQLNSLINHQIWPLDAPVFHPYAPTKRDGSQYGQVKYTGNSEKYYCHKVTLQVKAGGAHVQDLDTSHIAWIGDDTTKNINPHHLTLDSNEVLSLEAPDLSKEQVDRSVTLFLSLYISSLGLVCFNHS